MFFTGGLGGMHGGGFGGRNFQQRRRQQQQQQPQAEERYPQQQQQQQGGFMQLLQLLPIIVLFLMSFANSGTSQPPFSLHSVPPYMIPRNTPPPLKVPYYVTEQFDRYYQPGEFFVRPLTVARWLPLTSGLPLFTTSQTQGQKTGGESPERWSQSTRTASRTSAASSRRTSSAKSRRRAQSSNARRPSLCLCPTVMISRKNSARRAERAGRAFPLAQVFRIFFGFTQLGRSS